MGYAARCESLRRSGASVLVSNRDRTLLSDGPGIARHWVFVSMEPKVRFGEGL